LKIKIEYIIIVLLVVALILQRQCSSPGDVTEKITVETKYDTIKEKTPVYVPKWDTRTEVDIDTFLSPVDSLAILKEFYTLYNYIDTVGTDSVKIVINDSITTNKIIARQVDYKVIYPTITITKEKTVNKTQYFYGFGLGGSSNGFNYVGPELMLKTKTNTAYGLGIGINNNLSPVVNFRMYWKIGK
jgi:hypothetical protein